MRNFLGVVGSLLLALLVLTGCGSSDFDPMTAGGSGTTSTGGSGTTGTGGSGTTSTGGSGTTSTGGSGTTGTGGSGTTSSTGGGGSLPIAGDDSYTSFGNTRVDYPAGQGLLQNDTLNGASLTAGTLNTTQGGTVTVAGDGSFTYTPPNNYRGTDTFTYTLSNSFGSDTGTVTFDLTRIVYYVDNSGTQIGSGTLDDPFRSFSSANQATSTDDTIFVFEGNGTSTNLQNTGGFLKEGVQVLGEFAGLSTPDLEIVPAGNRPVTQLRLRPTNNNLVEGLDFTVAGANSHAVFMDQDGSLTLRNNTFTAEGTNAILIVDTDGDVLLEDNSFRCTGGNSSMIRFRHGLNISPSTNPGIDTTLTLRDNTFTAFNSGPVGEVLSITNARGLTLGVDLSGNTVTGVGNGFWADYVNYRRESISPADGYSTTIVTNGDTVGGLTGVGLFLVNDSNGTLSLSAVNSTFNTAADEAVAIVKTGSSQSEVRLTGCTLTASNEPLLINAQSTSQARVQLVNCTVSNSPSASRLQATTLATFCLDATGNTFGGGLQLTQVSSATFQVEQLGTLSSLNNGATVNTTGTVSSVADGACGF